MRQLIFSFFCILIGINIAYCFSGVVNAPMQSMDTIGIWMLKAKAISLGPSSLNQVLHSSIYSYSHQQYPLLLPAIFALVGNIFGHFQELPGLLISPFVYSAILFICYKTLRAKLPSLLVIMLTYIYSMFGPLLAEGGRINAGNADIYITLCAWIIIFVLLNWANQKRALLIAALTIAIASQIKTEGVFLAALLIFFPSPWKKKLLPLLLALTPTVGWQILIKVNSLPSDVYLSLAGPVTLFMRTLTVLLGTAKEMFNVHNWYIFWPWLFVVGALTKPTLKPSPKWLAISLGAMYFGFLSIYILAPPQLPTATYVSSSIDRIMLQLSPLVFGILAEVFHQLIVRETPPKQTLPTE